MKNKLNNNFSICYVLIFAMLLMPLLILIAKNIVYMT